MTILITGISGVGKTTFAKRISEEFKLNHISIGDVVLDIARELYYVEHRDDVKNLERNKLEKVHSSVVEEVLNRITDSKNRTLIEDNLFVYRDSNELVQPPKGYLDRYNISHVVLLLDKPSRIIKRRNEDISRFRLLESYKTIKVIQKKSIKFLKLETDKSSVKLKILQSTDLRKLDRIIKKINEEWFLNE